MAIATCVVCGADGPSEQQHIAGRANDPEYVVPVCVNCHRYTLTPWQWVHRVPLEKDAQRTDMVKPWAVATGAVHIIEAMCVRLHWGEVSEVVRTFGRLFRAFAGAPIDETIPIPKVPKLRKEPFKFFRGTGNVEVVSMLATMTAYLAAQILGRDDIVARFLREVARNPSEFIAWCESRDDELKKWALQAGERFTNSIQMFRETMDWMTMVQDVKECLAEFAGIGIEYLGSDK